MGGLLAAALIDMRTNWKIGRKEVRKIWWRNHRRTDTVTMIDIYLLSCLNLLLQIVNLRVVEMVDLIELRLVAQF